MKKGLVMMMMLAIASFIFITTISGQSDESFPASANWELSDPSNGGTGYSAATSGNITAMDESGGSNTHIRDYSGYDGSQRSQITGGAWPANQSSPISDVYIQFAMAPLPYSIFYLDTIALEMTATAIDEMKAEIRCSTDPAFGSFTEVPFTTGKTNNYVPRDEFFKVSSAVDLMVDDGETLYVRVYFWVEDPTVRTGKYLCLQNVLISGSGESLAAPASVKWFENGVQEPVITGGLLAGNPFYSDSMTLYDQTTDLPLNGAGKDVTAGAIHTVSQVWAAEPDTVSYLFFGFAVSPKVGGTFQIDSVKMNIGGWFESNFKAAVYYSMNEDFSDATLLIGDTQLPGNALNGWSAPLDKSVYDGQTLYLRIYPHNTASAGWAKLIAVNDILIKGTTTGITADPPVITTVDLSYLSTTFVTGGGNVPSDGGSVVTERGVVWDTAADPTIEDSKTSDGSGSGSFVSQVTGLTPGTTYHLRAYATNKAGTSYGEEKIFGTLDSIVIPTVTTASVTAILVQTTESGGNVTEWGGDTVKIRGICWNTTGSPTIEDSYTDDGDGLGSFNSTLYPLAATTKYYVRAYATNSAGTGYGNEISFTTQAPAPDVTRIVARDGSGDYTTVQAAFNDVPDLYTGNYVIEIKPGVYEEKLLLASGKVNVTLLGEHPDSVILVWNDNANTGGTSGSYSVAIDADNFTAENITFQNTNTVAQAVALRVRGDRMTFYHCKLRGFQDTYYTWGLGRIYMNQCHIEGAVDYIFGRSTVVFDSCDLKVIRNGAPITAASTDVNSKFGYVFRNCRIYTDEYGYDGNRISGIYLGRPWQGRPQVVYMYCEEPSNLATPGWTVMTARLNPLFAEYQCFGPGFKPSSRSTHPDYTGIQLTDEEASAYTIVNIFSRQTNLEFGYDWMPDTSRSREAQSVTFDPLTEMKTGQAPLTLDATATSGLEIVYTSSDPSVATIRGNTLTIAGAGTATITASQPGNFYYLPAQDVEQELTVIQSDIKEIGQDCLTIYPNPADNYLYISTHSGSTYLLEIINANGMVIRHKAELAGPVQIDISDLDKGLYFVVINGHTQKISIR